MKMVQVNEDTHYKLKMEATRMKMTIKDYIDYLLNREINNEF